MAVNGNENENPVGEEAHGANSYFEAFAGIAAALDALAKAVTPDEEDDGTPADEGERPSCNSYFASFRNIIDALGRLKTATEERLVALSEKDPNFAAWKEAYSIGLGKGASPASNGIAIGWNATAGSGTGTGARDSGAVAVGKAASALGIDAVAIGRGAVAGSAGNRTTQATVQLGAGANENDGTLQFRDWPLVDAEGNIPAERLPAASGGLVEATGSFGTASDRTTGLWYAVFTLDGLGIVGDSVCLSGLSLVSHTESVLPAAETRRLEIRTADGTTILATSRNEASFALPGRTLEFRFTRPVELRAGTRYRMNIVDSSGANSSAPVMLASTAGAGGYLASVITGRTGEQTAFFPCVGYTTVRPAPEIAAVLAEAKSAVESAGAFAFATPSVGTGGVISLVDRAVNAVSLTGTLVLSPPVSIEGKARSFVVRLTMTAETDWSFPSGVTFESDDEGVFGDIETGATATFFFTEVSENRFLVARKDAATVTKG
jgi:hypothetical protein